MKQSDTTPWYKQFWPWFLITIPVISMILSITMLNLALNTEDSLVIDDYYKEGRGINLELTKVQEAKVQDISTRITFNNKRVSLEFNTGAPQSAQALQLFFYHPTLQNKDFSLLLIFKLMTLVYIYTTANFLWARRIFSLFFVYLTPITP